MVHLSREINWFRICVFDVKVDHLNGICVSLSDSERYSAKQTLGGLEYLLQSKAN